MQKTPTDYTLDLFVNFAMLAINLIMLVVMLTSNASLSSVSLWERAINRGLLMGNVVLALLSFYWIHSKRLKLQKLINETTTRKPNINQFSNIQKD